MRVFPYALYLSIIPLSDAADIYLDPKGLDSNPGSAEKPVKSIKKAQELARELISSIDDDITVRFSPGTLMIDEPISFTGKDSASAVPQLNGLALELPSLEVSRSQIGLKAMTEYGLLRFPREPSPAIFS
jgi:hypothetical protein